MQSKAGEVAIVAHSYGGIVTTSLMDEYSVFFHEKVKAIAFTDSVHSYGGRRSNADYFNTVSQTVIHLEAMCCTKWPGIYGNNVMSFINNREVKSKHGGSLSDQ